MSKIIKIAILADSLALPRGKTWGDIAYHETYPYLLEQRLRDHTAFAKSVIIERGLRFRTIQHVLDDWDEIVVLREVNFVIIHTGIVDCAPRVFTIKERNFIATKVPPALRKIILGLVNKYRQLIIRLHPNKTYISEEDYRLNLKKIVKLAKRGNVNLVFINTITPPDFLEGRSPGYQENVKKYNLILKKICQQSKAVLIDIDRAINRAKKPESFLYDGMHINSQGHELLATLLFKSLIKSRFINHHNKEK
jgi:hypothetical protein